MPPSSPLRPRFGLRLALAWTAFVTAALWLGLSLAFVAFGRGGGDIVLLGLVQVLVYALVIALFAASLWNPPSDSLHRSVRDLLALRPTSFALCLCAAALGATLQIPATLLSDAVEHFFPLPDSVLAERLARITPHSALHGFCIFAVVAGLGPCVEEFFFRGALFGALRRGQGAGVCITVVSFCFALGHLDWRLLIPLFAAALVIGEVRELTGSIWPGLALHAAFNAATLSVVFTGHAPEGKPPPIPVVGAVFGCASTLALFLVVRALALSSPVAQNARQRDVH